MMNMPDAKPAKSATSKWLVVLSVLSLLIGSFYVFMIRQSLPVTRKGAYERVLEKSDVYYHDILTHFPRSPIRGAHLVQFFHQPKILQGGAIWIARFNADDPAYVDGVLALYPSGTQPKTLSPEEFQAAMLYQWDMVCRHLKTKKEDLTPFYTSYEPLIVSQRTANHGHASGLFVSRERSEVIYWATKN